MNTGPPTIANESEARALMAILGKAENEFVTSLTAPLFWVIREREDRFRVRNGSAFFLDAGEGPFGVTANHVVDGWRQDCAGNNVVAMQLGDIPVDFENRNAIIAAHEGLDIATFSIATDEIEAIGKTVLTGYQGRWPPPPPQQDRGVYFAGFPGINTDTTLVSHKEIVFGPAAGGGVASSISEQDVSSLIDREKIISVLGGGIPPENYDFGGISGGPMLSVIEYKGLIRSWALAGVIYEGPNPSLKPGEAIPGLEIIRARRAHFIRPDGELNISEWDALR